MEKKFNEETLQHEFESIWKELKPKVIARIETEPNWKNKNWKVLVDDIYNMVNDTAVVDRNDELWDALMMESFHIIFNPAVKFQLINDENKQNEFESRRKEFKLNVKHSHKTESIWKELKPKVIARIETEPDWIYKHWTELEDDVHDMVGRDINHSEWIVIWYESCLVIYNPATYRYNK